MGKVTTFRTRSKDKQRLLLPPCYQSLANDTKAQYGLGKFEGIPPDTTRWGKCWESVEVL